MALGLPHYTTWAAVGVYTVADDGTLARDPLQPIGTDWHPEPDPTLAERARLSRRVETGPPELPRGHAQPGGDPGAARPAARSR